MAKTVTVELTPMLAIAMSEAPIVEQAVAAGKSQAHWRQIRSALVLCGIVSTRQGNGQRDVEARHETVIKLWKERDHSGETAATIAKRMGMSRQHVNKIVNGKA